MTKNKPIGCCNVCGGTGNDIASPETNGKCWDCYGSGHPHDPKYNLLCEKDLKDRKMYDNETFKPLPSSYGVEILRAEVGSTLHGVSGPEGDDLDQMGICVEPPRYVTGLDKFEQYIYRTQPEGARSGVGDLDLTVYSVRKWMNLALSGNPSILNLLFARGDKIAIDTVYAATLRDNAYKFRSQQAAKRYLGYLESQKQKMFGEKSGAPKRPELVDKFGFDTKFAYHMVRLGIQGVEFMSTGHITLPMPEPDRTWLRELRNGEHTQQEALARADSLAETLERYTQDPNIPVVADRMWANTWLHGLYRMVWAEQGKI